MTAYIVALLDRPRVIAGRKKNDSQRLGGQHERFSHVVRSACVFKLSARMSTFRPKTVF